MRLQDFPFVKNLRKRVNNKRKWAEIYKQLKRINVERIDTEADKLLAAFVFMDTPQGSAYWWEIYYDYCIDEGV